MTDSGETADGTDTRTGSRGANGTQGADGTATPTEGPVELLEHEWYEEGTFESGVRGLLRNVSGETLSYVEVEVLFLDEDGVHLESGLDNTTELVADRRWRFDVDYLGSDDVAVADYEIGTSTTAYDRCPTFESA